MNQRRKLSHNDNFIKGLKTKNINKANFITNNSSSSTCGEVRGRGRSRDRGGKNRGGKKGVNEDVNITSETRGRSFAPLPPYNHCGGPHKTLIYWFKYPEFALIDWRKLNGAKIADFQKKMHMVRANKLYNQHDNANVYSNFITRVKHGESTALKVITAATKDSR